MKNKILLLMTVLACSMLTVSCSNDGNGEDSDDGGGSGGGETTYGSINHLDIAGATYLYTTKTSAGTRSEGSSTGNPAQLFKVSFDGTTEEVVIKDVDGNNIPTDNIVIYSVTDDLIFFACSYSTSYNYRDWPAYFARKSDGAVFEIPVMFYRSFGWEQGKYNADYTHIYADKSQNIYCPSGLQTIYKITSTSSAVTATELISDLGGYSSGGSYYYPFVVDNVGNIIYNSTDTYTWCYTSTGKKFMGGSLDWLPITYDNNNGGFISRYSYDGNTFAHRVNTETLTFEEELILQEAGVEVFSLSDKIIAYGHDIDEVKSFFVIKNPNDIERYDAPANLGDIYNDWSKDNMTDNYLYWNDGGNIYSFNFNTGETVSIYSLNSSRNNYNFSYADNAIMFYSFDKFDQVTYLAKVIDAVYSETPVDESGAGSAQTIIDFIRIN